MGAVASDRGGARRPGPVPVPGHDRAAVPAVRGHARLRLLLQRRRALPGLQLGLAGGVGGARGLGPCRPARPPPWAPAAPRPAARASPAPVGAPAAARPAVGGCARQRWADPGSLTGARRMLAAVNRPAELDRVFDGLRPHPHRGDIVGAGAVVLATAIAMVNVRMDATWGDGVFLVVDVLGFALVFAMGMLAELEDGRPRPYQSALLVAGLFLLALTLYRLAQVFAVDRPLSASGTVFWMALVVSGGVALLAFVDLVFDPQGPTTARWILLLLLAVYVLASLWRRDRDRRHAVQMVNAAGLAVLALESTFFGSLLSVLGPTPSPPGFGWALVILAGGFGLVAYSAVDREPGPGYLGV